MNLPEHADDVTFELDAPAGVIRLKAAASFGDPVELTADSARELAQELIRLADELE